MMKAAKMVTSEMLKYGYQPKIGLGPRADGILWPIQLKHQRGTIGLGYEPISGGACSEGFGVMNWTISPSLFRHESCANIKKNPRSTIMTCNESVVQNASDEQYYEEYDGSMMPENLPQEIEHLKSQKKPNMDETEVVNLGDEE
ncbi:hypothetical protein CQW23_23876 [Capsicum baccatum]|uniref:G-patch domain-containing protein n=1 Tax=Capsicum baccatum TaxID=33114 RepID=A0A2G2VT86_CAPBA|nr:hypothetical protein CQW23_23876 [Capsicum baccatum]